MLAAAFSAFPVLRSEQEPYAAVPASASMHHAVPGFPSAIGVLLLLSCFEFIKEVKSEQFLLSQAQLVRADLQGANLTAAILSDANLSDAVLSDADFSGAILTGA